ncbi:Aste57867_4781 [Aphanomyces stellatus]|uniref:Aste57867_4781 protein n=1 Tax=Aphanomyces stellatus TaxID=120398 RepID=A0A485KH17_9STRA|nr:hypothetical protein As57867_004768 [Aphanomyces stellatus]VFT81876.1 Aste57867_4781 [Aphanomyces stellatus]
MSESNRVSPATLSTAPTDKNNESRPFGLWHRAVAFGGLGYMISSLSGSILYISSMELNMANDFWWAHFNTTGTHAYLGNWYSRQLLFNPNEFSDTLDQAKYGDDNQYNTSSSAISVSQLYPKIAQFEATKNIENAIQGLRQMDGCQFPWVMTQYCWLDFKQQYPMANTGTRQMRCQTYRNNGAVYLESGLRNIQWAQFRRCYGAAFEVAFANELTLSQSGAQWLHGVQHVVTSLNDEAAYWRSNHVDHYTLQYQNFKKIGLVESFDIENAFGMTYSMTLKSTQGSFQMDTATSMRLYWSLSNDLNGMLTPGSIFANRSLLATSANFVFSNATIETALVDKGIVILPYDATSITVQTTVGPFGSIDAYHVPCPTSMRQFYKHAAEAISEVVTTNDAAQVDYMAFAASTAWATCPPLWKGLSRLSGNIMCSAGTSSSRTNILSFWTDGSCGSISESIYSSRTSTIVASMATPGTVDDIWDTCRNEQRNQVLCQEILSQANAFTVKYLSRATLASIVANATKAQADMTALHVLLVQFANGAGTMLALDLFNSPDYGFFSWGFAIEWLMGAREVVAFEGDVGPLVLLGSISLPVSAPPNPLEIPTNVALYFRGVLLYITAMLVVVASLGTVHIVASGGHVEGLNMLELNRVGGIVWTGRPLLFLRSIVAICLLSTATLELEQFGPVRAMTKFQRGQLAWYKLVLAAGEVGWFVYVVGDIGILVTQAYTTTYAVACGLLVWLVAAIFTVCFPVTHRATVNRSCTSTEVDFQLTCTAGVVAVGSFIRFLQLIGVALGCVVLCYVVERLRRPHLIDSRANASLLLSTGSKYLFALDDWRYKDGYYLDKASAVITGILCVEYKHKVYVFDIKLWRTFELAVPETLDLAKGMYDRAKHSIPLVNNPGTMASEE